MSDTKTFLTKPQLAKRWSKSTRTITRWCNDPPAGFPLPIRIGDRDHWDVDTIEAYEKSLVAARPVAA